MSDIYVPGVTSRFDTDKLIEGLMRVERIPKERIDKNVEHLETQKTYWQDVGRRITTLRESARILYSFQNPFNDRIVRSSDELVITGTATREATQQERNFIVKQTAQADRFLSSPQEDSFRVEGGSYAFSLGNEEISMDFRGGSLREFTEAVNRRGRDKIRASLVTVEPGTKSLLVESLLTGEANRLGFSGNMEELAVKTGLVERIPDSRRDIPIIQAALNGISGPEEAISVREDTLRAAAGGGASISLDPGLTAGSGLVLAFETATEVIAPEDIPVPQPPPGPAIPEPPSVSYGGITIENDPSSVPIPPWKPPPPPVRVDNMMVLSLTFSDGTRAALPPIRDSEDFSAYQYRLSEVAGNKTITSINLLNDNTHRDISLRSIRVFDPDVQGGIKPTNPISVAQDAVVEMDGIRVKRPTNNIEDLIPGVSLTIRGPSERPVKLGVEQDRESVKNAIFSLVGNYNRLMAEVNVLTRNDDRIIQELSYLSTEEQEELKKRLGSFAGDSTLNQFKQNLQRIAGSPYPTMAERDLSMFTQIGIGTDVRGAGAGSGYDPSRLRGYLEIDERILDNALETKLQSIQQLFGNDTDGDLIVDSGIAYSLENLSKPYVESGGIISLKTGTIDSRISQDQRRIETLNRQLAAKEAALKLQYGQMEGAYNRMEQMSTSLEQFSQRSNNNNR
ncbi:MAG: flagellar filament capping protein FliD [Spirochaetaceae bacterium]|jgi:flagellar hook-associated protein 2|nr:flagellar filament capping protein FliD [Spirochaetaceae bacterium]